MINIEELLKTKELSDGMRQYLQCKQKCLDCIMFYRLGDFYEMFFDDAELVSNLLELTLTAKACGLKDKAPMCGVPAKARDYYISKLVELGYKVAICEQLEDPSQSKGLVKRDIIRIVTPGTTIEENLDNTNSNYLLSIYEKNNKYALSYLDISQGDVHTTILEKEYIEEELSKIKPSEIVFNNTSLRKDFKKSIDKYNIYTNEFFEDEYLDLDILEKHFNKKYLSSLDFDEDGLVKTSIAILLNYIFYTQKRVALNINTINIYDIKKFMVLDSFTREGLDLTKKNNNKIGSLFFVLDKTNTAMGARLLKRYIEEPLINKETINNRLNLVEEFFNDSLLADNISIILKKVYDMERLCGKIAFEKINAKELINLKKSIESLPMLKHLVYTSECENLKTFLKNFDDLSDIFTLIDNAILDEPDMIITEGNIIKPSYNKTLEKYLETLTNINNSLSKLEESERIKLGTKNLKIHQNNVDGYYLEITKNAFNSTSMDITHYKKIKDLNSSYRFTFPELRQLELDILEASNKSKKLEYDLFVEIRNTLANNIFRLKNMAKILSALDVFISLSKVAKEYGYVRPILNEEGIIDIKDGRHPVIEIMNENTFIGNDTYMDKDNLIHLITGPNMSGKSTYMRQLVLITLMAQIGSFVPCSYANISICDRLFTRIGASDNLTNGESTFMVEMNEVSHILNNATDKSLIILDEVGRGTSTYDGISLAKAIVEYISLNIKCNTLFATHYFEITDLANEFNNIKNFTVDIKEDNDKIEFLRKIIPGCANKSYGIYVANLAKLPKEVIKRAEKILNELENKEIEITEVNNKIENSESSIDNEIKNLNLMHMTPFEAFKYLHELQEKINKKDC